MEKAEFVAAQKAILVQAQDAALDSFGGACFDGGVASVPAGTGGLGQADIDAAVAIALAAAKAVSDQALADAKAQFASDIAAVQKSLADMTAKEQLEESAVADVQAKVLAVQASFDAIKAIFIVPAPVPADPAPVVTPDAPAPEAPAPDAPSA